MQLTFGSGIMFATALTDVNGNAVANPTPRRFGTLQEGSMDISWNMKELYGQYQFPVDIARGTAKIKGTAKFAQILGDLFNDMVFGVTVGVAGEILVNNESGTIAAGAVTVSNGANFLRDEGVVYQSTGLPLKRVASAPAAGQYSGPSGAGVYTFNVSENATLVYISYTWNNAAGQKKIPVVNQLLGNLPTFGIDFYVPYKGKNHLLRVYSAVSEKLAIGTKLEDYMIPDFAFSVYANAAGNVFDWSTIE